MLFGIESLSLTLAFISRILMAPLQSFLNLGLFGSAGLSSLLVRLHFCQLGSFALKWLNSSTLLTFYIGRRWKTLCVSRIRSRIWKGMDTELSSHKCRWSTQMRFGLLEICGEKWKEKRRKVKGSKLCFSLLSNCSLVKGGQLPGQSPWLLAGVLNMLK